MDSKKRCRKWRELPKVKKEKKKQRAGGLFRFHLAFLVHGGENYGNHPESEQEVKKYHGK